MSNFNWGLYVNELTDILDKFSSQRPVSQNDDLYHYYTISINAQLIVLRVLFQNDDLYILENIKNTMRSFEVPFLPEFRTLLHHDYLKKIWDNV